MAPARTSPLPAVASEGVATAERRTWPSGAAMTVFAPFRTTTCSHSRAAWMAAASRAASSSPGGHGGAAQEAGELARGAG